MELRDKIPFETRYTYDFINRFLLGGRRRILEVGCGAGELAARLLRDGHVVVAVDADSESVAAARRLGVDARVAKWPDFDDGYFDAIVFARSLHHIHPLDESVRHAANRLRDGGRVIVEDFAYESVDEKTLRWFTSALRLLKATGSLDVNDEFLERVLSKTETLQAWRQSHEDELHTAVDINAQLEQILGHVIRENAEYYFRYVANVISSSENRDAILQTFARQEETLSADGSIVPLGRRFVATRTS